MEDLERSRQWLAKHRFIVDAGATLLAGLLVVPWSYGLHVGGEEERAPVWALLLVVPLVGRRVAPVLSAVAVFTVAALHLVVGPWIIVPADGAVLVSLYSVTAYGPRWAGRTAMAAVVVGAGAAWLVLLMGTDPESVWRFGGVAALMMSVMGLAVWAFALLRRARQRAVVALRDRAERLERERDQQAELAAAAERARIAREMHDVVAHSLSVVIAQADGGRYAAPHEAQAAVRALDTISETGRSALADIRGILGVLRAGTTDGAPGGSGGGPPAGSLQVGSGELAPLPDAADLEQLIDRCRRSGLHVSSVEEGSPRTLSPGLALTVFRVCQEALTNVLKHAGPAANVVILRRWEPAALVLDIRDDGRGSGAADDGLGHGLVGMRERVALFDGTLWVGPQAGGGFRVHAELPLAVEPDAPASQPADGPTHAPEATS